MQRLIARHKHVDISWHISATRIYTSLISILFFWSVVLHFGRDKNVPSSCCRVCDCNLNLFLCTRLMGDGKMQRLRLLWYLRQKDPEVCTPIPRIDPLLMHRLLKAGHGTIFTGWPTAEDTHTQKNNFSQQIGFSLYFNIFPHAPSQTHPPTLTPSVLLVVQCFSFCLHKSDVISMLLFVCRRGKHTQTETKLSG